MAILLRTTGRRERGVFSSAQRTSRKFERSMCRRDGTSIVQPRHRSIDQVDWRHIKYRHLLPVGHQNLPIQRSG